MNQKPATQWGPSHHTARKTPWWTIPALFLLLAIPWRDAAAILIAASIIKLVWKARGPLRHHRSARLDLAGCADPLAAVLDRMARLGGGVFLGLTPDRGWRLAQPERAVLVLGPPRSGKSTGLIIPAILTRSGPVVSTSTKPDVLQATLGARSRLGQVWEFDPTGHSQPGQRSLRWSPVTCAATWDGALMIAKAMVSGAGVGIGTTDHTHWSKRASALLAPLLHAAELAGLGVDRVVEWVMAHELDHPGSLLQTHEARLACSTLTGLQNTEARERSSIFSAAADALDAYTAHGALAAATNPNFNADEFVRSQDTIYIHAPAEHQALAAPLVCGLLAEIRRATYKAHAQGRLRKSVLFALDEAANIAPLSELPAIAAEGGGQGLALIASFQDLSQARARWGILADGFLTVFGEKLILPGIADTRTLESVSLALGEYDRQIVSTTRHPSSGLLGANKYPGGISRTTTIQRQRILAPGDVANIPAGKCLHLDGVAWELLALIHAHRDEPFMTLSQLASEQAPMADTAAAATCPGQERS